MQIQGWPFMYFHYCVDLSALDWHFWQTDWTIAQWTPTEDIHGVCFSLCMTASYKLVLDIVVYIITCTGYVDYKMATVLIIVEIEFDLSCASFH